MALYEHYQYQGGGYYGQLYFECYNILGDSSVKIWRDVPNPNNPPVISNVSATPSFQILDEWVNITCNVFDETEVDIVKVNISYPSGATVEENMSYIHVPFPGSDVYFFNSSYSEVGEYSYFILAEDVNNNQIVSDIYLFTIAQVSDIADLAYGWNFISPPFNQSLNTSDFVIYYNNTNFLWEDAIDPINGLIVNEYLFAWDRIAQSYLSVDTLVPGYGYWMFAYEPCSLLVPEYNITFSGEFTDIEPNWNVVSVPYNKSVNKEDIIVNYGGIDYSWPNASANGYINDIIFGWEEQHRIYIMLQLMGIYSLIFLSDVFQHRKNHM